MRQNNLLLVLAVAILSCSVTTVIAEDNSVHTDPTTGTTSKTITPKEAEAARKYWTPERMRNAKPFPMPTVDGNPVQQQPSQQQQSVPDGPPMSVPGSAGSSPGAGPQPPQSARKKHTARKKRAVKRSQKAVK